MRRLVLCAALIPPLLSLTSCASGYRRTEDEAKLFGPKSMRIHPTFTRVKDWTGDGKPDGIEAVVELQDEFGEPTRATGSVMFELYQYRQAYPDVRGRRIPEVWVWPLLRKEEQLAHWSRALRAYSFKIPFDQGRTQRLLQAIARDGDYISRQGERAAEQAAMDQQVLRRRMGEVHAVRLPVRP